MLDLRRAVMLIAQAECAFSLLRLGGKSMSGLAAGGLALPPWLVCIGGTFLVTLYVLMPGTHRSCASVTLLNLYARAHGQHSIL